MNLYRLSTQTLLEGFKTTVTFHRGDSMEKLPTNLLPPLLKDTNKVLDDYTLSLLDDFFTYEEIEQIQANFPELSFVVEVISKQSIEADCSVLMTTFESSVAPGHKLYKEFDSLILVYYVEI